MDAKNRRKKSIQLLLIIAAIVIVGALIWFAFGNTIPELLHLLRHGDRAEIRTYLASRSQWKGLICTLLLAILQVVSIVFPGLAVQLASGLIYGWWKAFIICYIGFIVGNIGVFIAVRMLGRRVNDLVGKQTERSFKNRFFRKLATLDPTLMVGLAYLLPLVPNGIIPYIAANTKISMKRFATALMATSWFQIILNCLAGALIIRGHYFLAFFMFVIQGLVFLFVGWKGGLFTKTQPAPASENVYEEENNQEGQAANQ